MTALATGARVLAIAIAIAGVVDPALTSMRTGKPDVAIVAINASDSAAARRIRERLGDDFTVIDGSWDRAAAKVIVGDALPAHAPSGIVFGVRDTTQPAITRFDVPATVTTEARTPIATEPRGAELRANGVIVDRDTARRGALAFSPTAAGPLVLEARAGATVVTALTNVVDRPHAVLFFDRRPSWMSTFVRRSLESDRRFAVASRVVTSRNVSTDAGQPPSTLSDPSLLELYEVIVIGTPGSLTSADVAGLEAFLRRRGGAVVLLHDEEPVPGAGTPGDRLSGVTRWTTTTLRAPVAGRAESDSAALRVTAAAWPATLPVGADVRTVARVGAAEHPLVWASGFGGGQVIVSGAFDSWKFRDRSTSGFDEFWRATISRAAREAGDAVSVEVSPNVAKPGEVMTVRVTVRDSLAKPDVRLDSAAVAVWPGERAGQFIGRVRVPAAGDHWVRATAGGAKAEAAIAVRAAVSRAADDGRSIALLARASGGITGSVEDVQQAIRSRVVGEPRLERWWPMRNGWWILPFVALLGLEWWARRRQGLA